MNTFVHEKGFFRLPRRQKESWAFCCSSRRDPRKQRSLQDYRREAVSDEMPSWLPNSSYIPWDRD